MPPQTRTTKKLLGERETTVKRPNNHQKRGRRKWGEKEETGAGI
jgi:hypothetical protein